MLFIYRWFKGYLKVLFFGDFFEKILDITAKNGITLWNSRLTKNGMESYICIKDFKKLKNLIRKKEIKVKILKKYGLPFKIEKNKKRTGFIAGIIIFFIFLKIMSGYIWVIDVSGNKNVKTEEILSVCSDLGIKIGTNADDISSKTDSQRLLLKLNGLSWASLNIEGSRLTVNVSEVKVKKDEGYPCNLVASFDGIIKKVDVKSGNCLVKTGETVKKGDILVSGIIENASSTQFVKSEGTVTAIASQNISVSGEFKQEKSYETGQKKTKRVFEFFNIKIPLYLGTQKGEYSSKLKIRKTMLFKTRLPISLYERNYKFLNKEDITLSNIQLQEELKEKAKILIEGKYNNYTVKREEFINTPNGLIFNTLILFEDNIAVKEKLIITT